jgi:hypothetical protein
VAGPVRLVGRSCGHVSRRPSHLRHGGVREQCSMSRRVRRSRDRHPGDSGVRRFERSLIDSVAPTPGDRLDCIVADLGASTASDEEEQSPIREHDRGACAVRNAIDGLVFSNNSPILASAVSVMRTFAVLLSLTIRREVWPPRGAIPVAVLLSPGGMRIPPGGRRRALRWRRMTIHRRRCGGNHRLQDGTSTVGWPM